MYMIQRKGILMVGAIFIIVIYVSRIWEKQALVVSEYYEKPSQP